MVQCVATYIQSENKQTNKLVWFHFYFSINMSIEFTCDEQWSEMDMLFKRKMHMYRTHMNIITKAAWQMSNNHSFFFLFSVQWYKMLKMCYNRRKVTVLTWCLLWVDHLIKFPTGISYRILFERKFVI